MTDLNKNSLIQTDLSFKDQVAFVTGAAAGLGRAYAIELGKRGARLALGDLPYKGDGPAPLETFAQELRDAKVDVKTYEVDVSEESQVKGAIEATIRDFGRLDILINNAGNALNGAIGEATTKDMEYSIRVHVFSSFWSISAALPHMRKNNYGRIINTTSALGAFGMESSLPYVTAKAGVIGLIRGISRDIKKDENIKINGIAPVAYTKLADDILSNVSLDKDKLTPEGVAPIVAYLAHESCSLHGEIISGQYGRAARIFTAVGPGFIKTDGITAEQVRDHLEAVTSTDNFEMCEDAFAEFHFFPATSQK